MLASSIVPSTDAEEPGAVGRRDYAGQGGQVLYICKRRVCLALLPHFATQLCLDWDPPDLQFMTARVVVSTQGFATSARVDSLAY